MLPSADVDRWALLTASVAFGVTHVMMKACLNVYRAHDPKLYQPQPRTRGLKGFFFQHLPEIMQDDANVGYRKWMNAALQQQPVPCAAVLGTISCWINDYTLFTPEDIEYILLHRPENFPKTPLMYDGLKVLVGKHGLLTDIDEGHHGKQRRQINPSFRLGFLHKLCRTVMEPRALATVQRMHQEALRHPTGDVNVENCVSKMTMEVVADAAFHVTDDRANEDIIEINNGLSRVITEYPFLVAGAIFTKLPIRAVRTAAMLVKRQTAHALGFIQDSRRRMAASVGSTKVDENKAEVDNDGDRGEEREDEVVHDHEKALVDLLVSTRMTDEEIIDNAVTFLFAGSDTTSITLTMTCYLLATHPSIQATLYDELIDAFPTAAAATSTTTTKTSTTSNSEHASSTPITTVPSYESVRNLKYLDHVIKEGLRLYNPASGVGRITLEDDILPSGLYVPKGKELWVSISAVHRHPKLYAPDPDAFRPERWEDPTLEERIGPCGFMPFSVGKRNCIGKDFAMMEMKIFLSVLLLHFELAPISPSYVRPKMVQGITAKAETDVRLKVIPRRQPTAATAV